jgi:hypothetical protein
MKTTNEADESKEERFDESKRDVKAQTTNEEECKMETRARDGFEEVVEYLTFFEEPEHGSEETDIDSMSSDGEEVVEDAVQFGEHGTNETRVGRGRRIEETFERENEEEFLSEHGDIIESIEVEEARIVIVQFDELFGAAMEQTYFGYNVVDIFVIHNADETKDTMSGGMGGTEIKEHSLLSVWRETDG